MKTNTHWFWKVSTMVFAGALAWSLNNNVQVASAEPQPHMRDALSSLRAAKRDLEKASSDKGGHRVKALELTKAAIEQVEKGIDHDNKHDADADETAPEPLALD